MHITFILILTCLLLGAQHAESDDIDIYLHSGVASKSYVHVLMDLGNSDQNAVLCTYGADCAPPFMTEAAYAHLSGLYSDGDTVTAPGIFKAVLAAVVDNPLFDDVYLSLLISNHQDNRVSPVDEKTGGGTLLEGYKRLGESRNELVATLKSTPVLASAQAHVLQPRESYFEWYRYIRGGEVALGTNTSGNFGQPSPNPDYDSAIISNGKYLTPFTDSDECPRLYSILFSMGSLGRDDDLAAEISAATSLSPDVTFEQLLAYMHDTNTDLLPTVGNTLALQKTWVVAARDTPGNALEYARAGASGSVLYVDEPADLEKSLVAALSEVISVSSSFVPPAISAGAFTPGVALDNVFVPLFQAKGTINWPGNLKKLKLVDTVNISGPAGRVGGVGTVDDLLDGVADNIVDVQGNPAFELAGRNRGRISFDALTFWTDVGTLPPGDGVITPENADGREVARGGAGQKIDGFVAYDDDLGSAVEYFIGDTNSDLPVGVYPPRQLFYEPESGSDFSPFDVNAATRDVLGSLLDPRAELTDDEVLDLIRWGRGQDVGYDNGEGNGSSNDTARSWILGDILHSRPYALNYGMTPGYSKSNPNIRLLLGSGDGMFHIIENTDTSGNETGREVFAFYPRELLGNIRLRRDNTIPASQMRYGVDGVPVVFKLDRNGDGTLDHAAGDEAYVYFGLRRGGYSYFALDISNPSITPTPSAHMRCWSLPR